MLKQLSDYKNDKQKNIIYFLRYNQGGLCDFIKFGMHLFYVCEKLGVNFKIKCDTMLNDHIDIKEEYAFKERITSETYKSWNCWKYKIPENQDVVSTFESILKKHSHNNLIVEPTFLYSKIKMVFPVNINFKDYTTNKNISEYVSFFNFIGFKQKVYKKYITLKSNFGDTYKCIHLRCGDKYLETKPSGGYCISDNRLKDIKTYISKIQDLVNSADTPVIFLCDNKAVKNMVKKAVQNIHVIDSNIIHVGYNYSINKLEVDNGVIDTLVDFLLLMNSKENFALSYSGFSIISSLLGGVKFKNL